MSDVTNIEIAELRSSNSTNPKKLAGSIYRHYEEGKQMKISAVGPAAVNQAMKACAIARGYLTSHGVKQLYIIPAWADLIVGDQHKSGMIFRLVIEQ